MAMLCTPRSTWRLQQTLMDDVCAELLDDDTDGALIVQTVVQVSRKAHAVFADCVRLTILVARAAECACA